MVVDLILGAGGITTILIFAITLLVICRWRYRSKLPPGPVPFPLIGNLMTMKSGKPKDVYRCLRAKYGDLFTLHLGSKVVIVFNGYETLKEAFVKRGDVFSDRPAIFDLSYLKGKGLYVRSTAKVIYGREKLRKKEKPGIIMNSGEPWKKTRTHTLGALREFGFGRKSLQNRILEEVDVFLECIAKENGQPFDVGDYVFTSVSNVICSISFGDRFDHNDEQSKKLIQALTENFGSRSFVGLENMLPMLRYLPFDFFGIKKRVNNVKMILNFSKGQIKQHKNTYDEDITRDLIDAFIREERKEPENYTYSGKVFMVTPEENLSTTLFNLFGAGTDTTSTTIRWAILYMIHYPEIQEKVRNEIEKLVGSSRQPTMEDKPNLPYVEAFYTEVLRHANIAPNSVPHAVSEDVMFNGYLIPKGASLILNLDSVLADPDFFPNPLEFNPLRFIGADGKFTGSDKVIAFSIGRRQCLAESLARMELFLFLTSMVQRFQFFPENADGLPSMEGITGVTYSPKPYKFRAVKIN